MAQLRRAPADGTRARTGPYLDHKGEGDKGGLTNHCIETTDGELIDLVGDPSNGNKPNLAVPKSVRRCGTIPLQVVPPATVPLRAVSSGEQSVGPTVLVSDDLVPKDTESEDLSRLHQCLGDRASLVRALLLAGTSDVETYLCQRFFLAPRHVVSGVHVLGVP